MVVFMSKNHVQIASIARKQPLQAPMVDDAILLNGAAIVQMLN